MRMAEIAAERSSCKRAKVGTIITDEDMTNIISIGYNGNYKGGPNGCDSDEPGHCGCIHSEINALLKPGRTPHAIMFVTETPCINCAKAIINSGIKKVYYRKKYRLSEGFELLISNKILTEKI